MLGKFGGFYRYLWSFQNLKNLKLHCLMRFSDQVLDLEGILDRCNKVEHLKVYSHDYGCVDKIHIVSEQFSSSTKQNPPPSNNSMKKLCLLNINDISVGSLEYKMYGFKASTSLQMRSSVLGNKMIGTDSASVDDMLDKFTAYCQSLEQYDVFIKDKNGKELVKISNCEESMGRSCTCSSDSDSVIEEEQENQSDYWDEMEDEFAPDFDFNNQNSDDEWNNEPNSNGDRWIQCK